MERDNEQTPKLSREESASEALKVLQQFREKRLREVLSERRGSKDKALKASINVQLLQSLIQIPQFRDYVRDYVAGSCINITADGLLQKLGEVSIYPGFTEIVTFGEFGQEVNPIYDNSDKEKTSSVMKSLTTSKHGTGRAFVGMLAGLKPDRLLVNIERGITQKPRPWKPERVSIGFFRRG